MKYHTTEQAIADMKARTGFSVCLRDTVCDVPVEQLQCLRLFSDYFDDPPPDAPVEGTLREFLDFYVLNNFVPEIDKPVDPEKEFSVYVSVTRNDPVFAFYKSSDKSDEVVAMTRDQQFKFSYSSILILDKKRNLMAFSELKAQQ